jgi:hypothetical protein
MIQERGNHNEKQQASYHLGMIMKSGGTHNPDGFIENARSKWGQANIPNPYERGRMPT